MIKALFFDFDGTISDTKKIAFESISETLKNEKFTFDSKKLRKLMGAKSKEIFKGLGLDKKYISRFRKDLFIDMKNKVSNGEIKLCTKIKPLKELSKKHIMIVISNGRNDFIRLSSKKLKTDKIFNHTYGSNSFKTKDKMIKKIARKYKLKHHEIMYVGDRFSDIRYARKAGVYAVAIHNPCAWSTMKEILKEKPDFIVHNFEDLKKLVKKIK